MRIRWLRQFKKYDNRKPNRGNKKYYCGCCTTTQKCICFGSYAKGNATETSDVDLLIIMADSIKKISGSGRN